MKAKIIQLNREFSMRLNVTFLALEASWRNLVIGYFIAIFSTCLVLSSLLYGCECQRDLPYGKVCGGGWWDEGPQEQRAMEQGSECRRRVYRPPTPLL